MVIFPPSSLVNALKLRISFMKGRIGGWSEVGRNAGRGRYDLEGSWSKGSGVYLNSATFASTLQGHALEFRSLIFEPVGGDPGCFTLATMFQRKTHLGIVVGVIIML